MKNKICIAGNIVLDLLYPISGYPTPGKLTTITDIGKTVGGSVPNVGIDIKRLMPDVTVTGVGTRLPQGPAGSVQSGGWPRPMWPGPRDAGPSTFLPPVCCRHTVQLCPHLA